MILITAALFSDMQHMNPQSGVACHAFSKPEALQGQLAVMCAKDEIKLHALHIICISRSYSGTALLPCLALALPSLSCRHCSPT